MVTVTVWGYGSILGKYTSQLVCVFSWKAKAGLASGTQQSKQVGCKVSF